MNAELNAELNTEINTKIINTLRILSVDMVQKSNSGHPGMPLGCATMMFILWCRIMRFDPSQPLLNTRDRFILSNGHGCALLYSMLYLLGYNYCIDDLKKFRQLHSITPGHPEINPALGIEVSTGPLGQGIANGVGMAISSKKLGLKNHIYVMCGDGCLMEGVSYEAASFAGHLKLNNLIVLYDDNGITIDGKTDITFTENTRERFKAMNWNVLEVLNGDTDTEDIYDKLLLAKNSLDKPSILFVKTTIGYGCINAGKSSVHGAPLGTIATEQLKEYFHFNKEEHFFVDKEVQEYFTNLKKEKASQREDTVATTDIEYVINEIKYLKNGDKSYATRDSSHIILNKIAKLLPNIIVGSADLAESNKTMIADSMIDSNNFNGKYLNYGVREHAMASIANGISTYGIIPVVSTFLVFITYCLAPIRMAGLSKHKVIYVLTHDSVFLGEDGPTHQPVESLTLLRSIPNVFTIRPCDTTEMSGAYQIALQYNGPTALILSRQVLPNVYSSCMDKMKKGAYAVHESKSTPLINPMSSKKNKNLDLILVATGSEVSLAIEVSNSIQFENKNIRVVSMPCCELYDLQTDEYKENILPKNVTKISIEAGTTLGWYKYVNYTYGIDCFGESGKMTDLKEHFGFTVEKVCAFIEKLNI